MDSDTTGTTAPPTKHPDFWFHDGSIIFSVQNTLFRVHQTVLSNHSEFFAGLFTVPQPSGEAVIDGCHVVPLYDKVDDVIDLLKAVYDPSHFDNLPPEAELDSLLDFISGILRLSTKYVFQSLRRRCISLLSSKLPTSFAAYKMKAALRTYEPIKSDAIMRVIHLAYENHVLQILPYAYYCVARMGGRRILTRKEGDIDWETKSKCLVGRDCLRLAVMKMSHSFLFNFRRSPQCRSPLCAYARGPYAEWHVLEAEDPLDPLGQYTSWHELHVCREQKVWNKLPSFFGMSTWNELKSTMRFYFWIMEIFFTSGSRVPLATARPINVTLSRQPPRLLPLNVSHILPTLLTPNSDASSPVNQYRLASSIPMSSITIAHALARFSLGEQSIPVSESAIAAVTSPNAWSP
ncbi:uncharacterized protein LACBIDRAFT_325973 [Laccaria bicolor S238N-H82]|uniref:Predicted protein n=1 Tax=Laccaria bicolor (strain S238N-H82 / ATCC MYA-4686) TaxID=486041 RepID=B0D6V4_LACBS|nr:uncharacterized protein LACBIDRAFT_325973 [Laccaria bicolor S238N-H82]EDR09541.1 predicted protein [Laccaria bicolor S238N-H82]|eukprot:XP_001879890.1 predicted protein [Laccaria bicolor S238N-H82]